MGLITVRLLAIPGSHPCAAAAAMLDAKGVEYERVDLVPVFSRAWLRLARFPAGTVPALRLDGVRVQGSRAIARAVDDAWPQPPLFPADPLERMRIEEIEAWGDGPLQDVARRIVLWAIPRSHGAAKAALDGARLQLHLPIRLAIVLAWPLLHADGALHGASADAVRADLAALPAMLDRVDAWIASGELGGDPPTAADFQLAGSLRLLSTLEDLAPLLADRAATELARRLIPSFPGHVREGTLPGAWLPW